MKQLTHGGVYWEHFKSWFGRFFPGRSLRSTTRRYYVDSCGCEVNDPEKATAGTVQVAIYDHVRVTRIYATGPKNVELGPFIRKATLETPWFGLSPFQG